jgi:general secretion pathway protein D
MLVRPHLFVALVTCLLASTVASQVEPASSVQVPETVKLSRLVDLTAEVNRLKIVYNPADLDASVTLRVQGTLSPSQVHELMTQVLASRGFTTVRSSGGAALNVVKVDQAAATSSLASSQGAGFATQVIRAHHQTAKSLAESIRPLLSKPSGAVAVLGDSSLLIISDFSVRLREIEDVVRGLDVADPLETREVNLEHVQPISIIASATALNAKREMAGGRKLPGDLVASPDGTSVLVLAPKDAQPAWLELIARLDRREGVETVTYTPRYFAAKDVSKLVEASANSGASTGALADDRFRIIVDDLTSSLIVTATAPQHERIAALLSRLDSAEQQPQMPVRSFALRNRPVSEVVATLERLIAAGVLESGGGDGQRSEVTSGASQTTLRAPLIPPGTSASPPPAPQVPAQSHSSQTRSDRPSLSLTADEPTNTLIAIGEPRMLSQLETLLQSLDVRQPQVMLEVQLVSLTDSEALSLGAELERIGSIENASVRLSSLFGLSTGGAAARTVADAAGFTGAVLNPGEFSIVVRALETLNKGRSVSNPKVLVSNNEKAVFSSTLQQPVQQLTRTGSNDSTFSYGGTENAGTTISVKPQIAQGDHLVLTYSIKLSSFVGASTIAGLPPPKQENSVDSVATIPDGHTVVVGGLDLITDSKGESRIPFIGGIPVLGELFKTRNNSSGRTRFFVFIKATVLRGSSFEDLKYLSATDLAGARVDDGFPEVHPRVIR